MIYHFFQIKKVDKIKRFAVNWRNLKQALNHGLVLKIIHKFIKFN